MKKAVLLSPFIPCAVLLALLLLDVIYYAAEMKMVDYGMPTWSACKQSVILYACPVLIIWLLTSVVYEILSGEKARRFLNAAASLFSFLVLMFLFITNGEGMATEKPKRILCMSNLKQIQLALRAYAEENKGYFPEKSGAAGLKALIDCGYLSDIRNMHCPSAAYMKPPEKLAGEYCSYEYTGGLTERDDPDSTLASDKKGNHGKHYRNVLTVGGSVKSIKD